MKTAIKQAREELLALIIDSRELKVTHSYRRAKEIFEDEPRWKVRGGRERDAGRLLIRGLSALLCRLSLSASARTSSTRARRRRTGGTRRTDG